MKLRNKKTGEIGELIYQSDKEYHFAVCPEVPSDIAIYKTLADLNEEWEDYEEPKDHWYINYQGEVYVLDPQAVPEYSQNAKSIGNYFNTREEAEKAVEKLKAWKRLEDKGFEFTGYDLAVRDNGTLCGQLFFETYNTPREGVDEDMTLLFGGEE
jgi:hypothetical protein